MGKLGVDGRGLKPDLMIIRRAARDHLIGLDRAGDSRLSRCDDPVADRQVTGYAHLSRKNYALPHAG